MPFNRLSTTKIAKAVGCHPNTVRLYEKIGFLSPVPRSPKGYRLYREEHLDQMRLARMAMEGPWPGHPIRHSLIALVQKVAAQEYSTALEMAQRHLALVRAEQAQADAAVEFLQRWVHGQAEERLEKPLQVRDVARLLDITPDMMRNWERSGLVSVPRNPSNRYRQYQGAQVGRLRVIRLLRQVGYSPMAILRMLIQLDQALSGGEPKEVDLRRALDTPRPDEEVSTAFDHWLSTLAEQEQRALHLISLLEEMDQKYTADPVTGG